MKFTIQCDQFLKSLQLVANILEKKQTLPILSNILLSGDESKVSLTGTDLEIEIQTQITLNSPIASGKITIPGRKLLDICRNLPPDAILEFEGEPTKCVIRSRGSRFLLATLPADDFPSVEKEAGHFELAMKQSELLNLMQRTSFAIAQKDVRYYLNGMLLEIKPNQISFVATDGHRLALNRVIKETGITEECSVIIPRKSVFELIRLLSGQDEEQTVSVCVNDNHLCVKNREFEFVTRLIEGRYPNYELVIPKEGDKIFFADKVLLKQSVVRASILSNERLQGVCFQLRQNMLHILANNPEREEANEQVPIDYQKEDVEIGFNASYLIDALNTIASDEVKLTLFHSNSAFLVEEKDDPKNFSSVFVVMPMRL